MGRTNLRVIHGSQDKPVSSSGGVTADRRGATEGRHRGADRRKSRARRRHQRLKVSKRVEYRHDDKAVFAYTKDLGSGGMFLRTTNPLTEGAELDFTILLESDQEPVAVRGTVVRAVLGPGESGVCVSFTKVARCEDRAQIAAFVLDTLEKRALERITLSPHDAREIKRVGDICFERGQLEKAEERYRRVLELRPGDHEAHGCLAQVLLTRAGGADDQALYAEALREVDIAVSNGLSHFEEDQSTCRSALVAFKREQQEEASRERQEAEAERRRLADESRENETFAKQLQRERKELESLKQELAAPAEALHKRKDALKQAEDALTQSRADHKRQVEAQRECQAKLEADRKELTKRRALIKAAQQEVATERKELTERRALIKAAQQEVATEREVFTAQVQELDSVRAELNESEQKLLEGSGARRLKEDSLAERRKELQALETELEERERRANDQLERERAKAREEQQAQEAQCQEDQLRLKNEQSAVEAAREQNKATEQRLQRKREALQSQQFALQAAKQELQDHRRAIDVQQTELESARTGLGEAQQQLEEQLRSRSEAALELDISRNKQNVRATELNDLQERLRQEGEQQAQNARREAEKLQQTLKAERDLLAAQETQQSRMQAALEDAKGRQDGRRQELQELANRLEEERQQLEEQQRSHSEAALELDISRNKQTVRAAKLNDLQDRLRQQSEQEAQNAHRKAQYLQQTLRAERDLLAAQQTDQGKMQAALEDAKARQDARQQELQELANRLEAERQFVEIRYYELSCVGEAWEREHRERSAALLEKESQLSAAPIQEVDGALEASLENRAQLQQQLGLGQKRQRILEEQVAGLSDRLSDAKLQVEFKQEMLSEMHAQYERHKEESEQESACLAHHLVALSDSGAESSWGEDPTKILCAAPQMHHTSSWRDGEAVIEESDAPQEPPAPPLASEEAAEPSMGNSTRALVMQTDSLRDRQPVLRDRNKSIAARVIAMLRSIKVIAACSHYLGARRTRGLQAWGNGALEAPFASSPKLTAIIASSAAVLLGFLLWTLLGSSWTGEPSVLAQIAAANTESAAFGPEEVADASPMNPDPAVQRASKPQRSRRPRRKAVRSSSTSRRAVSKPSWKSRAVQPTVAMVTRKTVDTQTVSPKPRPKMKTVVSAAAANQANAGGAIQESKRHEALDGYHQARRALTHAGIVSAVKRQAGLLKSCLSTARAHGELRPGSVTLALNWTIQTNGRVTSAYLSGPAALTGSSLATCLPATLQAKWRFPPSAKATTVGQFPLGPIRIR